MATQIAVGTTKEIFNRIYTYINPLNEGKGEWRLTNIPSSNIDYKGLYTILPITSKENSNTGVVTLNFSIKALNSLSSSVSAPNRTNEIYKGLSANKAYLPKALNGQLDVIAVPPVISKENNDNIVISFDMAGLNHAILQDRSKKARREKMKVKVNSYNEGSATVLKGTLPIEVQALGNTSTVSFDIVNLPSI